MTRNQLKFSQANEIGLNYYVLSIVTFRNCYNERFLTGSLLRSSINRNTGTGGEDYTKGYVVQTKFKGIMESKNFSRN